MAKRKNKKKGPFYVYTIEHNNKIIYVGMSNNLLRRQKEHTRNINKQSPTKTLYKYLVKAGVTTVTLNMIAEFKYRSSAKSYEAFTILTELFIHKNYNLTNKGVERLFLYHDRLQEEFLLNKELF